MKRLVKFKINKKEYEMINDWKPLSWSKLTEEWQDVIFIAENKKAIKRYHYKLASDKRKKTRQHNKEIKQIHAYYNLVKKYKGLCPSFRDEVLLPELEKSIKRIEAEEASKKVKTKR